MKCFVSWSGGKDCALACHRAMIGGHDVRCLFTMARADGRRSWTHRLRPGLLRAQARAMRVPLRLARATAEEYERTFVGALRSLRDDGAEGGVFGDIDAPESRQWVEAACAKAGIAPLFPLWGERQEELIGEFLHCGFEALVVAARLGIFPAEWLGRRLDTALRDEIVAWDATGACGERGEYHTLLIAGPMFGGRHIETVESRPRQTDGVLLLDVARWRLTGG